MTTRKPFAVNEWYHCYNRGVDKRKIFLSKKDYERFLALLYVANGQKPVHISNFKEQGLQDILTDDSFDRGELLVEIGVYALMPNHLHIVLKEVVENGIALFMQKVFTGYTMYFNKKYERSGALFAGTFKSKHISDDRYVKWLVSYIHLNPVELFEPRWKEGIGNIPTIEEALRRYPYSSLYDFVSNNPRPEKNILGNSIFDLFESKPSTKEMLQDAQAYRQQFIKVKP